MKDSDTFPALRINELMLEETAHGILLYGNLITLFPNKI